MKRISESERIVMDWIWAQGPCTSSKDIIEYFCSNTSWKQTTVSTFLRRLIDKGYLSAKRIGRNFEYTPSFAKEEFIKSSIADMIDKDCDGSLIKLVEYYYEYSGDTAELNNLKLWIDENI